MPFAVKRSRRFERRGNRSRPLVCSEVCFTGLHDTGKFSHAEIDTVCGGTGFDHQVVFRHELVEPQVL